MTCSSAVGSALHAVLDEAEQAHLLDPRLLGELVLSPAARRVPETGCGVAEGSGASAGRAVRDPGIRWGHDGRRRYLTRTLLLEALYRQQQFRDAVRAANTARRCPRPRDRGARWLVLLRELLLDLLVDLILAALSSAPDHDQAHDPRPDERDHQADEDRQCPVWRGRRRRPASNPVHDQEGHDPKDDPGDPPNYCEPSIPRAASRRGCSALVVSLGAAGPRQRQAWWCRAWWTSPASWRGVNLPEPPWACQSVYPNGLASVELPATPRPATRGRCPVASAMPTQARTIDGPTATKLPPRAAEANFEPIHARIAHYG